MKKALTARVLTPSRDRKYICLYVAGSAPHSSRAIANLKSVCESRLTGRYELTVVDLYKQQERALEDQIVVVPTLVRQ